MPEKEATERRRFSRFPATISLRYLDLGLVKEGWANTVDISSKGLGLTGKDQLQVGACVDVYLTMPDTGEKVLVKGKVVWISSDKPANYRTGIYIDGPEIKPIPIVLRTIHFHTRY